MRKETHCDGKLIRGLSNLQVVDFESFNHEFLTFFLYVEVSFKTGGLLDQVGGTG